MRIKDHLSWLLPFAFLASVPALGALVAANPQACQDLKPGEFLDFSSLDKARGSPEVRYVRPTAYRLIRDAEVTDLYRVVLNFDFSFVDDVNGKPRVLSQGEEGWPARNEAKAKHVRACFEQVNPKLVGPKGERIRLELFSPGAPETFGPGTPPAASVRSYSYPISPRSYSSTWGPETDPYCETVIHESLHQAGLVDTYPESSLFYYVDDSGKVASRKTDRRALAYDCRIPGPADSVMSDQWDAFEAALGSAVRKTHVVVEENGRVVSDRIEMLDKASPPSRDSLLYPAEFYKIIQSNPCDAGRDAYSLCTQGAYSTSFVEGCPKDLPSICKAPGFAWMKGAGADWR